MTIQKIRELQLKQGTNKVQLGTLKTSTIKVTGMVSNTDELNKKQLKRQKLNQVLRFRQLTQSNWKRIIAKESIAPFKLRKGAIIGVKNIVNDENKVNILKIINIIGQIKMLDPISLNKILWKGDWNMERNKQNSESTSTTKKPTIQTIKKNTKKVKNKEKISYTLQVGLKQLEMIKEVNYSKLDRINSSEKSFKTNIGCHFIIKNTISNNFDKYIYYIPKLESSSLKWALPNKSNLEISSLGNWKHLIYYFKYKWHTYLYGNIPSLVNIPKISNPKEIYMYNRSSEVNTETVAKEFLPQILIKQKAKTIKDNINSINYLWSHLLNKKGLTDQQEFVKKFMPFLQNNNAEKKQHTYIALNSIFRLKQSQVEIETKGVNVYTWLNNSIKLPTDNKTNILKKPIYILPVK